MLRKLTWALLLALGIGLTACTSLAVAEDDDEQETTIKFSEAPKAVQDTFKKEGKGTTPETLVKEIEKGKTVYEGEVTIDGKKWEIEVSDDGTVLEREAADGDDDDDDDADDDDAKEQESQKEVEKK